MCHLLKKISGTICVVNPTAGVVEVLRSKFYDHQLHFAICPSSYNPKWSENVYYEDEILNVDSAVPSDDHPMVDYLIFFYRHSETSKNKAELLEYFKMYSDYFEPDHVFIVDSVGDFEAVSSLNRTLAAFDTGIPDADDYGMQIIERPDGHAYEQRIVPDEDIEDLGTDLSMAFHGYFGPSENSLGGFRWCYRVAEYTQYSHGSPNVVHFGVHTIAPSLKERILHAWAEDPIEYFHPSLEPVAADLLVESPPNDWHVCLKPEGLDVLARWLDDDSLTVKFLEDPEGRVYRMTTRKECYLCPQKGSGYVYFGVAIPFGEFDNSPCQFDVQRWKFIFHDTNERGVPYSTRLDHVKDMTCHFGFRSPYYIPFSAIAGMDYKQAIHRLLFPAETIPYDGIIFRSFSTDLYVDKKHHVKSCLVYKPFFTANLQIEGVKGHARSVTHVIIDGKVSTALRERMKPPDEIQYFKKIQSTKVKFRELTNLLVKTKMIFNGFTLWPHTCAATCSNKILLYDLVSTFPHPIKSTDPDNIVALLHLRHLFWKQCATASFTERNLAYSIVRISELSTYHHGKQHPNKVSSVDQKFPVAKSTEPLTFRRNYYTSEKQSMSVRDAWYYHDRSRAP
jgi:hypothetical protein